MPLAVGHELLVGPCLEPNKHAHQARILQAISEFHASARAGGGSGRGIVDALAEVVRSASGMSGKGFFGVVYQLREGEAWQNYDLISRS